MTDNDLRAELARIAERAEPVPGLARAALRAADRRRRRTRLTAMAVAAMAAIVLTPVLYHQGRSPDPAPALQQPPSGFVSGLPDNSPKERALAQSCMRDWPPVGAQGQPRSDPEQFRLLVNARVNPTSTGFLAQVANGNGYVICEGQGSTGTVEMPALRAWPDDAHRGLWSFAAPLRVDGILLVQSAVKWDGRHVVLVGRSKSDVARVEIVWNGGLASPATVDRGFFLGQPPTGTPPEDRGKGAMSPEPVRVEEVVAFDARGRTLHTWRPKRGEGRAFDPLDCRDPLVDRKHWLCAG